MSPSARVAPDGAGADHPDALSSPSSVAPTLVPSAAPAPNEQLATAPYIALQQPDDDDPHVEGQDEDTRANDEEDIDRLLELANERRAHTSVAAGRVLREWRADRGGGARNRRAILLLLAKKVVSFQGSM